MVPWIVFFQVAFADGVITLPPPNPRCRELLRAHQSKTQVRHRLQALILRNKRLQRDAPPARQTLIDKLKKNLKKLERESQLVGLSWERQRENVVRQGCVISSL